MLMAAAAYNIKKLLKCKFGPLIAAPIPAIGGLKGLFNQLFMQFIGYKQQHAVNFLTSF
jgi:hypothetical protein